MGLRIIDRIKPLGAPITEADRLAGLGDVTRQWAALRGLSGADSQATLLAKFSDQTGRLSSPEEAMALADRVTATFKSKGATTGGEPPGVRAHGPLVATLRDLL